MLSAAFVYLLFLAGCIEGIRRPWVGLVIFYSFVVLEPTWNWRWAIDVAFPYQKYIAVCILVGVLLSGIKRVRVEGAPFWSLSALIAFLGLAYISSFQSISPSASAHYLGVMWKMVLMIVLAVWLIDTPKKLWVLIWVLVICQGYNAFQINLQYFEEGFSRYASTGWGKKGDNNVYSIYTVPIMAMAASLSVYARKSWQWMLAGGIFVMQMHSLMLLESRGTMLGGMLLAAIFVVMVPKNRRVWTMLVTAFVFGAALAGPPVVREFVSAFESEGGRDSSASSRFELWKAGWEMTKDYPLLGVGPNASRYLVPEYYTFEANIENKALHNLFFEISTGCGLPATMLYLAFFAFAFWPCFQSYRRHRRELPAWVGAVYLAVICGIPGYWAASMFSSGALLESSYLLCGMGCAALLTHRRQVAAQTPGRKKRVQFENVSGQANAAPSS